MMKTLKRILLMCLFLVIGLALGIALGAPSEYAPAPYSDRLGNIDMTYSDDGASLRITADQLLWQDKTDEGIQLEMELGGMESDGSPVCVTLGETKSDGRYFLRIKNGAVRPDAALSIRYVDTQNTVLAEKTYSAAYFSEKSRTVSIVLFFLALLLSLALPWLLMKLVYGSRSFSELYSDFWGDPGMFFILCIPSAILLVAAKYFLL